MTKDNLPTVDIKGREYVLVKDRILSFNEQYPKGAIETEMLSYADGQVIVKATVWPEGTGVQRFYVGHSQARESDGYINKTSALENAETSAVGRALAMMGIGVIESIASADEIAKATAGNGHSEQVAKKRAVAEAANTEVLETFATANHPDEPTMKASVDEAMAPVCETCGESAAERSGVRKSGREYHAIFCSSGDKSHTTWL